MKYSEYIFDRCWDEAVKLHGKNGYPKVIVDSELRFKDHMDWLFKEMNNGNESNGKHNRICKKSKKK